MAMVTDFLSSQKYCLRYFILQVFQVLVLLLATSHKDRRSGLSKGRISRVTAAWRGRLCGQLHNDDHWAERLWSDDFYISEHPIGFGRHTFMQSKYLCEVAQAQATSTGSASGSYLYPCFRPCRSMKHWYAELTLASTEVIIFSHETLVRRCQAQRSKSRPHVATSGGQRWMSELLTAAYLQWIAKSISYFNAALA